MSVVDTQAGSAPGTTLTVADPRYPALLKTIHDPPATLHVRGDPAALSRPLLAIVGSRRASAAGLHLAGQLAGELVAAGVGVCSGLALGIDGAAHRGAVRAGGVSVAVMGTGPDQVYPRRHRTLAAEIAAAGCLVTEFPPGTPPLPAHFPQRNRIISGLALGVLIVEAAPASGSLITARSALEQGREVFALPWSPLHEGGAGCLQLLRDGAKMVREVGDILEELGPMYAVQCAGSDAAPARGGPRAERWLLDLVGFETVGVDALVDASGRAAPEVLRGLSILELAGAVTQVAGGYRRSGR